MFVNCNFKIIKKQIFFFLYEIEKHDFEKIV